MADFPVAEPLGCRALKDGALYLVFLLAAAGLLGCLCLCGATDRAIFR